MSDDVINMRREFAKHLHYYMAADENIILITADLGWGLFDTIRKDFPDRFINTGAAEQAAMGISVGLALSGKIPVIYSITPFLLWRSAETIRLYVNHESIPVKLIGSGRDEDYSHDGFSHYAGDDKALMMCFGRIECNWPEYMTTELVRGMLYSNRPFYLNLKR